MRSEAPKRLFGRRIGHRLSKRQTQLWDELLPRLSIDIECDADRPLSTTFDHPVREVWLEIGFGGGEHLAWQALQHPDIGFVGVEPFINGVAKLLSEIEERQIRNIKIHPGDARDLVPLLAETSIARAFVLFPDPWPKKRHHKRRLICADFLEQLGRVMKPEAELRVATDISDYARTMLLAVARSSYFEWCPSQPSDWRDRPADWPSTRYEQKALNAGRHCTYFRFRRKAIRAH